MNVEDTNEMVCVFNEVKQCRAIMEIAVSIQCRINTSMDPSYCECFKFIDSFCYRC